MAKRKNTKTPIDYDISMRPAQGIWMVRSDYADTHIGSFAEQRTGVVAWNYEDEPCGNYRSEEDAIAAMIKIAERANILYSREYN